MNRFAAAIVACFAAASLAQAEEVLLTCALEETGPSHAKRTWDMSFDQRSQLIYIGKTTSPAAITETQISFRLDMGAGVPFNFSIDRATGSISVAGNGRVLYTGQCKAADPSRHSI